MEEKNLSDQDPDYARDFGVTAGTIKKAKDTDLTARAMFYGEIGERDNLSTRKDFPKDALEETGEDAPANYMTDENGTVNKTSKA